MVTQSFWKGKRVFLTGHTGFKGSWLTLWLKEMGAHVTGFSLAPPTSPSLFQLADVSAGITHIEGDIRDLPLLKSRMKTAEPEIVFHLAAQPLVRHSYKDPVETYSTNLMGTVNFLEALRACPESKAAVVVTSDKCYENKEWPWGYRENEPMGGFDPYSCSKGCAELITSSYRKSFFSDKNSTHIATARAGNVIGGGDYAEDRLIPDLVRSTFERNPLEIRNPNAVRPWQHVLEPLSGYLMLAESLFKEGGQKFAEGWNFGPNDQDCTSVKYVVETFQEILNKSSSVTFGSSLSFHEAELLKLDISKARYQLGWNPSLNLNDALNWTAKWYLETQNNHRNSRAFTLDQIQRFIKVTKEN
ncbi:MAG: CDP-glucose 4,6-dehydratase [Pseudomonadota bacterium]